MFLLKYNFNVYIKNRIMWVEELFFNSIFVRFNLRE